MHRRWLHSADRMAKDVDGTVKTHFGYRTVLTGEKEELVGRVFSRVANSYDCMNDVMTGGLHRKWKDWMVQSLRPQDSWVDGMQCLDVAGGTGDIAFRLARAARQQGHYQTRVTIVDINERMLRVGQERAKENGLFYSGCLEWQQGNAEELTTFPDNTFDHYTIAFGIRNCTRPTQVISEAFRVLKPGGRFTCLELGSGAFASVKPLRSLYDWYSFKVIPYLGELVAADRDSYQYLVESIRRFPDQETFSTMLREAGFVRVGYEDYFQGIATLHHGIKA